MDNNIKKDRSKFLTGSTQDFPENRPDQTPSKIPYGAFWAVIGAIIVVVSSLIVYGTIKQNNENSNKNQNNNVPIVNSNEAVNSSLIPLPPEPNQIFSYTGTILKIEGTDIFMKTNVVESNSLLEKEIKIKTDDNTEFLRRDLSKISPPMPPGKESTSPELTVININKLGPSDLITAVASEDIKGKSEFTAKSVTHNFQPRTE